MNLSLDSETWGAAADAEAHFAWGFSNARARRGMCLFFARRSALGSSRAELPEPGLPRSWTSAAPTPRRSRSSAGRRPGRRGRRAQRAPWRCSGRWCSGMPTWRRPVATVDLAADPPLHLSIRSPAPIPSSRLVHPTTCPPSIHLPRRPARSASAGAAAAPGLARAGRGPPRAARGHPGRRHKLRGGGERGGL